MAATERQAPAESGHLIKRPRLTRILDESKARVILLVAPAGYGKTTLAREWLEGKPHVWYRASSADADVAALAVGIASAVAELVPGVDRRIKQHVRAVLNPEREASALAELVAEDIGQLPDDAWIAIDDYQFIAQTSVAERFVADVLDATSWRFLTTSRVQPSWARARRVIYGGAVALGREELEMTDDEVRDTVGRTKTQVPTLFENAMGWPAIVGLAARVGPTRLEGHTLPVDLHDFFAEELWQFLDETTRWQLAKIALAAPCAKSVAWSLLGDDAADVLERTTRGGWLTRDPDEIVIHPLLARFLHQRFDTYSSPVRAEALQQVLQGLTETDEWDSAMALALEQDVSAVPQILEQSLELLLSRGRLPTIDRWLQVARERRIKSAVLDLAAAEVSFRRAEYARAETLARAAASRAPSTSIRVRGLNTAGKSARWNERSKVALELHREARQIADDSPSLREAIIGEILASLDLGVRNAGDLLRHLPIDEGSGLDRMRRASVEAQLALHLGCAQDAVALTSPIVPLLDDVDDPLARTSLLFARALALIASAEYRGALEASAVLEREGTDYRIAFLVPVAKFIRAAGEAGLRNFTRARHLVREVIAAAEGERDLYTLTNASALQARIEIGAGSGSIPSLRDGLDHQSNAWVYCEYVLSVALAEAAFGDPVRARTLRDSCRRYVTSEGQVLSAWVAATLQPSDPRAVSSAFELTLARGQIDSFVVAYRGTPALLETLVANASERDLIAEILVRANDLELAEALDLPTVARDAKRQRLTRREREVYGLMVEGLSNRAIATRLFISESTAKLHVRHILEKLSARSRAQAVAKWRDVLVD